MRESEEKKVLTYCQLEIQEDVLVAKKIKSFPFYLDNINLWEIMTRSNKVYYCFYGKNSPMNLYPLMKNLSVDRLFSLHLGVLLELCSKSNFDNLFLKFYKDKSIFPKITQNIEIINKRLGIGIDKTTIELQGFANMIRVLLLKLADYLCLNDMKTHDIKNDDFKGKLQSFLHYVLTGKSNKIRRELINDIAKDLWDYNCTLVHKKSINCYDILNSLNGLNYLCSLCSNFLTSKDMPMNMIKCPICDSEEYMLIDNKSKYTFKCKNCDNIFTYNHKIVEKVLT